jgi:hypothetical protein
MSNQTITRIRLLRERIAQIDKMVKQGECFAAGVTVTVEIGANSEREPLVLDFGCYTDLKGILAAMRQGTVDSLEANMKNAKGELDELVEFFGPDAFRKVGE